MGRPGRPAAPPPDAIDDVAVVTDDVGGAQLATRHLLEHGVSYVACLGGTPSTPSVGDPVSDHVEGWRRAMAEAGRPTEGRLFQAPYNRYDAYEVALTLLAGPDRPPAIVCATDDQAIGVLRAARELRIDVPGELLVAASTTSRRPLTDPPLTTVASDRTTMARAAVDLVLDDALRVVAPAASGRRCSRRGWSSGGPAAAREAGGPPGGAALIPGIQDSPRFSAPSQLALIRRPDRRRHDGELPPRRRTQ
ncbi:substrate-binding domain-containing protein [Actinomadura keratinilytica]